MKKKLMVALLTACLTASMMGCGNTSGSSTESPVETAESETPAEDGSNTSEEKGLAALSNMTMEAEYFSELDTGFQENFGAAGFEVKTASAEFSPSDQLAQIENYITDGAKVLFVLPVEAGGVADSLKRAREAGVVVITQNPDVDPDAYDMLLSSDEVEIGRLTAKEASDWIDATYPDAEDGTIDTIIITWPTGDASIQRDDGIRTITDNPKVHLCEDYVLGASDSVAKVAEFIDMAILQYPDLKCIICHDSSFNLIADDALLKNANVDPAKVGIFGSGSSQSVYQSILKSANNESMVRGCVSMGDMGLLAYKAYEAVINGEVPENKTMLTDMEIVTIDNVEEYIK